MGEQVEVPVRIGGSTALGREHSVAAVHLLIHHRVHSRLTALRAHRVQQQQRRAGELTTHPPTIYPELLDDLVVPVAHDVSSPAYQHLNANSDNPVPTRRATRPNTNGNDKQVAPASRDGSGGREDGLVLRPGRRRKASLCHRAGGGPVQPGPPSVQCCPRPASRARTIAWARSATCSLSKIDDTLLATVFGATFSRPAIAALDSPA